MEKNVKVYKNVISIFLVFFLIKSLLEVVFYFSLNNLYKLEPDFSGLVKTFPYLLILATLFYINKKNNWLTWKSQHWPKSSIFFLVIMLSLCFRIVEEPIIRFGQLALQEPTAKINEFSIIPHFITLLNIVILGPIIEEIIFRGYIMNLLIRKNLIIAIIFSSILFTIVHIPANINSIISIFIFGLIASVISLRFGLLYAIIFHSLNNFIGYIVGIFNNQYIELINYLLSNKIIYWLIISVTALILYSLLRRIYTRINNSLKD